MYIIIASVYAENVTLYELTVEDGSFTQLQCDSSASPPFYYYRYFTKNINPLIIVADTQEERPWAVYAINASNSPANLRTIPIFLARSEQPLQINLTIEFYNNIVCCQGYNEKHNDHNVTLLSLLICYRVNVQCK